MRIASLLPRPQPLGERGGRATAAAPQSAEPTVVVLEARRVQRLAYTRNPGRRRTRDQPLDLVRHVLPFVETIEIGSGSQLIPVDKLERFATVMRRPARRANVNRAQAGRPAVLSAELIAQIRAKREAGESLAQIARELNELAAPTAHGGARWWPSTVRALLDRVTDDARKRTSPEHPRRTVRGPLLRSATTATAS